MKTKAFLLAFAVLALCPVRGRADSASPVDLIQDGLEAFMDERYDDAIEAFRNVLQYDKKNEAANRGLKSARQKKREQTEKRRALEKPALEAARKAMDRQDWPEAVNRLDEILARQPDHPEALALREKIRARMLKQSEKARKDSADWYYAQGVLASLDKDWMKALDSWDQVVAFNPDQVGLIAEINRAKERLKGQEDENKVRLYQSVAFDSLKKGDYAEAIRNWEQLLNLDPENAQAKEGVAEAQKAWNEQKGRNRQEEVQKLSEQAMDDYIERNFKGSRETWNKVLELDPDNTLARDYLRRMDGQGAAEGGGGPAPASGFEKAETFLSDGRYPEGIEYLERYTTKFPYDARARSVLEDAKVKQKQITDKSYSDGLMSYSQGDVPGAIRRWQDALRANPDYQRARQAIIKAMAEQKKRQDK